MTDKISMFHGAGGRESEELVKEITNILQNVSAWNGSNDDSAYMKLKDNYLVFTTDSFVASPLFFPGGDIGKIAACGTMNDLAVMGATPIGLSLALVIEEGFPKEDLKKIITSLNASCNSENIPVATGDTKVMENGKIDKLIINTSGIGTAKKIFNEKISTGDKVIVSGTIAEHGAAILTERFGYKANIKSDAKPILKEITSIKEFVKQARDPTRGGISATLNELAKKNNCGFVIDEEKIPIKKESKKIC
ncbi:MAG: hydrogenase expression/formation protein HypE, partial [Candidatus Aenigmarchaeota archaeon]|nr:hydrogenase expression/formation protein HypE [Candidatus Aenigmarchaeota archaeon]